MTNMTIFIPNHTSHRGVNYNNAGKGMKKIMTRSTVEVSKLARETKVDKGCLI